MTETVKIKFANLLLSAVNLQDGQSLMVRCEPVHWWFVNVLGREAYRRGAKYVHVEANHSELYKARIDHSRDEHLAFVPGFRSIVQAQYVDEGWARIVIVGQEDPDLLATLNPERNGAAQKAIQAVDSPFRRAIQADKIRWVVTALPTPLWAAKVLGDVAGTGAEPRDAEDKLWEIMEPIMRLDQPDPIAAWNAHSEVLGARQRALADLDLDSVQFVGPGTDLTIGLPRDAVWLGGGSKSPDGLWFLANLPTEEVFTDGLWFLANLPTEEVFTTPDFRRAFGEVTLTRPALILGRTVTGARFRFEEGKVVEWSAEDGEETLTALFAIDEQARYLGELALVDTGSPIYRSGLVFHNILLDENASCHIAFGSSYPGGIPGGEEMNPEEYRAAGGNFSAVHSDVMIGAPEVDVIGVTRDSSSVPIMTNGAWML